MSEEIELVATASFGLEAVVVRELAALGYPQTTVADGRVTFRGDLAAIARSNLWLRSADRVLLKIASFEARDFGELFERTKACDWSRWIPKHGQFPVRGKSVRSQLHSVPDCQAIVKKAIVEKLKQTHRIGWFEENGPLFGVEVSILKDVVTLTIDTTGPGLHKRGYRTLSGPAPLKETLAAGLLQLSFWDSSRPFWDPCCGTGTIPIEAALIAHRIAPGLNRQFDSESWPALPPQAFATARQEARDLMVDSTAAPIVGSDIDGQSLSFARRHAKNAGVGGQIEFRHVAFDKIRPNAPFGCLFANPPYGERSGDRELAEELARATAEVFRRFEDWSHYILTALPEFERLCDRTADRRRKLYNGGIACTYYQFHGPRPPRQETAPTIEGDSAASLSEPEAG